MEKTTISSIAAAEIAQPIAVVGTLLLSALFLASCATPTQRIDQAAARFGFEPLRLEGNGFELAAFFKPGKKGAATLHLYLEGDGTPWISRRAISDDPTPRDPVMLKLMALDQGPALYLGRPCYYGHAADRGCSPALWTHRRYGPEVVDSLAAALRSFLSKHAIERLVLFGHSGGGALAILLAPRFPETSAVVTLAANLDIDVWTDYHGYSPLVGSLNPARTRTDGVLELHYLGEKDRTIPSTVFEPIAKQRPRARVVVVPNFDHRCCWQEIWTGVLRQTDGLRLRPASALQQ